MQSDGNLSTSYVIVSSGVVSYLNNGVDDHGLNPISLQKKKRNNKTKNSGFQ